MNYQKNHIHIYPIIEEKITKIGVYDRVVLGSKKCEICNNESKKDFGYCKNLDGKGDFYDCCSWVDPMWLENWYNRIQKKSKIPYISNFVKWSSKYR